MRCKKEFICDDALYGTKIEVKEDATSLVIETSMLSFGEEEWTLISRVSVYKGDGGIYFPIDNTEIE